MHLSGLEWTGIGAIVIGLTVALLFFRGASPPELGSVSGQWIAEHRSKSE